MNRKGSSLDVIVLLILIVAGASLGKLQTSARAEGRVDFVSAVLQATVSPITNLSGNVSNSSGDFFHGVFAARRLTEENASLKSLAQSASLYTERLTMLEAEIDRLRKLQGFPALPGKIRIPATVVAFSMYENRLTLGAGSRKGVVIGAPVVSADGLVGTVQVVEEDRCQVRLLTNASLTIGAIDMSRDPTPAGLLRGENSSTLTVTFQDPKAPVEIGDNIATSGFSDRVPRGLVIGKVISVAKDEEYGSLRAKVDPVVTIGVLGEVFILK